jgi:hypothetical protein
MLSPAATGSGLSVLVTLTSACGALTVVEVDVEDVEVVVVGAPWVGCQFGSVSVGGTAVGRRVTPLPSGLATKMSGPLGAPNELDEKTIFVPSGDHAGRTELARIWCWLLPSAFMTHTELPLP